MVGGSGDAGQREEVAAAGRLDVVDQRFADQPRLHGLELAQRILLVAAEDEPDVEVAVEIETAVVVVAPAQDLLVVAGRVRGLATKRGGPDQGRPASVV